MKFKRMIEVEENVVAIRCAVAVRYEEDDMPNEYPHRKGETWDVTIDVETGQISNWPQGVEPRDLCMKVTDCGSYYLLNDAGNVVSKIENGYVPSNAIPGSYGDYIDFKIDANGKITNWYFNPDDFKGDGEEE